MKQGRSKKKGNKYENKISRIFSEWYWKSKKNIPYEDFFWRTAGSGAKSTRQKSAQTSFTGDITFLPEPTRLLLWIDTKSVKNASFDNILSDDKFMIHEWYKNEVKKMKAIGVKKPIVIIFKFYRKKENYIFFRNKDFAYSTLRVVAQMKTKGNYIQWKRFSIMKFEDFLRCVKDNEILRA